MKIIERREIREAGKGRLSPEGLTASQEKLIGLLFKTDIWAPVGRRRQRPDGTFEVYKVERDTHPVDFAQNPEEFAFKHHEWEIAQGLSLSELSPVAINLRNLPGNVLESIGQVLAEMPLEERPDFCVGIPNAGTALARVYSEKTGIPQLDLFSKKQTENGRKIVAKEGAESAKATIVIIDDVLTKGHSKLEAIQEAEKAGYLPLYLLVVVDRGEGGTEELKSRGYQVKAPLTLSQLIAFGRRTGLDKLKPLSL